MSDEARTVLVVTDDPCFSGQLSELMLRSGVPTLCFAQTQQALERAHDLVPDVILIHVPRARMDTAWACFELLQSDSTIASIPVLLYAPPVALAQRVVGAPEGGSSADSLAASDRFIAQLSSLIGTGRSICYPADAEPAEKRFPIGRDDL
jgi:CheY-like chemotaxis protein